MPKVYLTSRGEYSDYGIVGVYTTMEKAERAMAIGRAYDDSWEDFNDVEEFELDEEGDVVDDHELGDLYISDVDWATGRIDDRDPAHCYRHPSQCRIQDSYRRSMVWSPISQDHARKVAAEHRQELLRTNEECRKLASKITTESQQWADDSAAIQKFSHLAPKLRARLIWPDFRITSPPEQGIARFGIHLHDAVDRQLNFVLTHDQEILVKHDGVVLLNTTDVDEVVDAACGFFSENLQLPGQNQPGEVTSRDNWKPQVE